MGQFVEIRNVVLREDEWKEIPKKLQRRMEEAAAGMDMTIEQLREGLCEAPERKTKDKRELPRIGISSDGYSKNSVMIQDLGNSI